MVERSQPRHVDRRDQGMRRQRRITQWAVLGSAALIAVFGWIFAQPGTAAAGNDGGSATTGTAPKPKPKATPTPTKGAKAPKAPKNPKATKTPSKTLEPPPAPPAETNEQPDTRTGAS